MSEPYSMKEIRSDLWHVFYLDKQIAYSDEYVWAKQMIDNLNEGYAAGRRDALAEIEARNNKREEL